MQTHEIRYFIAVCREASFTKAADHCNVTQPALTRAIRKLEDELGGALFARERGRIRLTDLGRLLEPEFVQIMACRERARQTASRFLRLEGAHMTLGVMCTIGPLRFVSFLNAFRAAHPGIELTLIEGVPARLSEMLLDGQLDLAIMAEPAGFNAPLQARFLYEERFTLACGSMHPLAELESVRFRDLDGEIYLQRINCEYRDRLADILQTQGVSILRSHRSEREDWIQSMVIAGMGVCFLPEFSATLPSLVQIPVCDPSVKRQVCLVTVAGRHCSAPVDAFVAALTRYPWPPSRYEDEAASFA